MRLTEPGYIGDVYLKNRLVMAPMISNLCNPDGSTNEQHIRYLEERAKGGVSLIITEYSYVDNINARGSRNQMSLSNTDFIPKLRRLTERIHAHDCSIFVQLVHAGGKALDETNERYPSAPSSVQYPGHTPMELSVREIEDIVERFAKAASTARRSNFDGIELHGAHGYLIHEFLSPALNKREDRYGGSFENRIRFAQEVIDAVRNTSGLATGIRLSLYEDDEDGYGPDYGLKIAESLKNIDYVHFSAGRFAPPGSSMPFYGQSAHIAAKLPRKAKVTTMVVGSVVDLNSAEAVLKKADFVSIARALLADPTFAESIIHGYPFRPCIRCNQACRDNSFGEVRCTVNPETGLESVQIPMQKVEGEIVIVGAGVKGLEAALQAARSGLKATLYEQREQIGGQLLDYYDEYKKKAFSALLDYYRSALRHHNVDIRLGERYSGEALYCLPDREYEHLKPKDELYVDSNIFQHHDEVLRLAEECTVFMSDRSLRSLDRTRESVFRKMAESKGVRFVPFEWNSFDVSIHERLQYDIRAAMVSGREALRRYIDERRRWKF